MDFLAVFGITSDGLNLVVNLLLLFLVVFWLALVYWTFSDARRRIADPMVVGCATAASLFPFAGTAVYMIVRPPEYLEDVRERELEIAAAEVRLAAIEHLSCSYCNFEIERSFLRCPSCLRRLKEPCTTCGKPLAPGWKICPYCESEIGQAPPQPRRRTRPAGATPASGGQREVVKSGGRSAPAPSAGQRRPAASEDQRRSAATPERPRSAGSGQRPAAPDGRRKPAPGDAERTASAGQRRPRPGASARADQSKRPPAEAEAERPEGNHRKKRSGTPAGKREATQPPSDAATAEQPVARPRTRPPSAG